VLIEWNDRQLRRCDVREAQRVRCKKRLRLDRRRFAEGDVGGELLEAAAVEVSANGVADGAKARGRIKSRGIARARCGMPSAFRISRLPILLDCTADEIGDAASASIG